jgi:hypothetical protein
MYVFIYIIYKIPMAMRWMGENKLRVENTGAGDVV